jgi:hypothetical protein
MATPEQDPQQAVMETLAERITTLTQSEPLRWKMKIDWHPSHPGSTLEEKVQNMLAYVVPLLTDDAEKDRTIRAINTKLGDKLEPALTAADLNDIDTLTSRLVAAIKLARPIKLYPGAESQFCSFMGVQTSRDLPSHNPLVLYNRRYCVSFEFPSSDAFARANLGTYSRFNPEIQQFLTEHGGGNTFEGIDASLTQPAYPHGDFVAAELTFSANSPTELNQFFEKLEQNAEALTALRGVVRAEKLAANQAETIAIREIESGGTLVDRDGQSIKPATTR